MSRRNLPPHQYNSEITCILLPMQRPGPKLLSVSSDARIDFFVRENTLLPGGARCCPNHIKDGRIVNGNYVQSQTHVQMDSISIIQNLI